MFLVGKRKKKKELELRYVKCQQKLPAKIPTATADLGIVFHDKVSITFSYRQQEEAIHPRQYQAELESDTAEKKNVLETLDVRCCEGRNQ